MLKTRYYGKYGGAFLPEILISTFEELGAAFREARDDPGFWEEYKNFRKSDKALQRSANLY